MFYIMKYKKKVLIVKVFFFYKKIIGYGLLDFVEEFNYGVDLLII